MRIRQGFPMLAAMALCGCSAASAGDRCEDLATSYKATLGTMEDGATLWMQCASGDRSACDEARDGYDLPALNQRREALLQQGMACPDQKGRNSQADAATKPTA